jgi:hypothetical protein
MPVGVMVEPTRPSSSVGVNGRSSGACIISRLKQYSAIARAPATAFFDSECTTGI